MAKPIDPRAEIGRVRLRVKNLETALAFYSGTLGFPVSHRIGDSTALLSASATHPHVALTTTGTVPSGTEPALSTLQQFAIRYPDREAFADAARRLRAAGVTIDSAADHGSGEALYVRDPDGHRLELYWDRPRSEWPRQPDGTLAATSAPLDLDALIAAAGAAARTDEPSSSYAIMTDANRARLRDLRGKLLQLHKVLLDDTRVAYEMDRGRVPSNATLLQLVINDPWFAWLHSLSELVVRIDETVDPDSPATDADAATLIDQVEKLLTASENGEGFHRRYFDALQRQPAVVMAHADVRRAIKAMR
uniref:Glyoxalase/bleomycin resistance protein/dioxygenase n=1 Tax=uncultured bacterium 66 TaxID=698391 RepID=E3T666_9BACT|nr:glyoxalase/bleomycin resistance protein/dioxygenase [uncultured bacterium 66]